MPTPAGVTKRPLRPVTPAALWTTTSNADVRASVAPASRNSPRRKTVCDPTAAVADARNVSVTLCAPDIVDDGLKLAVTPAGKPDTDVDAPVGLQALDQLVAPHLLA